MLRRLGLRRLLNLGGGARDGRRLDADLAGLVLRDELVGASGPRLASLDLQLLEQGRARVLGGKLLREVLGGLRRAHREALLDLGDGVAVLGTPLRRVVNRDLDLEAGHCR